MFLVRDLVSARAWLATISHLAGTVTGFVIFTIFAAGFSTGLGLVPLALVGVVVLGLTLRVGDWFARAERARLALMLGVRIPAWPAQERAGYRWGIVPRWRTLTERATWGVIGYGFVRPLVSVVALTLTLAAWTAGLVMLGMPFYSKYLPSGGLEFGDTVLRGTPTLVTGAVLGLVLLLAAPQLARGFA